MNKQLVVQNDITIKGSVAQVWDALVNPKQTKKYMFGCEAISDWKIGSSLLWKMIYEGKEMIPVKGIILDIQPERFLKYTVIDAMANMKDIPENYLNVAYSLTEHNGVTTLTITQDGFERAADGEKRYQDVYNNGEGWNPILVQIRKLVED